MAGKYSKNKRIRLAIWAGVINFILFGIGMYMGINLTSLGTGLSLINTPIYA